MSVLGRAGATEHVFVSYSHVDRDWCRGFEVMLTPLVDIGRVSLWWDPYIQVGVDWRREIDAALERSTAALLLVSPEFLASRFIMDVELPALLRRGARLICVLVRACLFEHVPALARVQWAHDPKADGPLATAADRDGAITRICRRLVDDTLPVAAVASAGDGAELERASAPVVDPGEAVRLTASDTAGRLDELPALPDGYVERAELERVRAALLSSAERGLGLAGNARTLGLHGQGGIGKSVLAAAIARDREVARHFPDGVFWVSIGERGDPVAAQIDLLRRLGARHAIRSAIEGLQILREVMHDRRYLVIVDDVWTAAAAGAFRATGPYGRVLFTTRDRRVLDAIGTPVELVDVLPAQAARELLARLTQTSSDELPEAAEAILVATGRVALALALVGATIGRGGASWSTIAAELARRDDTFLDHPYANTFKAMQVAVAALEPELANAYRSLAVFPRTPTSRPPSSRAIGRGSTAARASRRALGSAPWLRAN